MRKDQNRAETDNILVHDGTSQITFINTFWGVRFINERLRIVEGLLRVVYNSTI